MIKFWPSLVKNILDKRLLSNQPFLVNICYYGHGMCDNYEVSSYSVLLLEKKYTPYFPSVNNQMLKLSQRETFIFCSDVALSFEIPLALSAFPKYSNKANPQTQ